MWSVPAWIAPWMPGGTTIWWPYAVGHDGGPVDSVSDVLPPTDGVTQVVADSRDAVLEQLGETRDSVVGLAGTVVDTASNTFNRGADTAVALSGNMATIIIGVNVLAGLALATAGALYFGLPAHLATLVKR